MSIQDVTKPMALDETLQSTNGKMDSVITKLQGIIDALGLDTSVYKAAGNKACAELVSSLLVASNLGNVYNITDSGTTTADFVEGAGKPIRLGDNVAIVDVGTGGQNVFKFDLLSGLVDLSNYVEKEEGKGLSSNDFTDDDKAMIGNIYANNTILSTDRTPYLNRPCLTPTGFSSYVREKLIGCSVAWNQILPNGNFGDTSVWTALKATMSIASNVATLVPNGQSASNIEIYEKPAKKSTKGVGHKYLISLEIKPSQTVNVNLAGFTGGQTRIISSATANTWTNGQAIINCTNDTIADFYIYSPNESFSTSDSVQVRNIQIIDLTLAFGSSVADTLYAMANNGGIDWLRNHNYPIDQYTQYGYGLYSSKPSAKKVVGFNKWDEQYQGGYYNASGVYVSASGQLCTKNMIPVFPNTAYCFRTTATGNNVCYYDKSGVFISRDSDVPKNGTFTTPNNAYYINISFGTSYGGTYNNDICINISDTNKNGTYEPYSCTTYSLGNTELRGHLIVQNGEIVAEGDVRESNGNITRKYKRVNLGDYNWTKSSDLFVSDVISDCVVPSSGWNTDVICSYYAVDPNATDKRLYGIGTGAKLAIKDTAYNDATAFKTAMNGIYLEYPLATPTTEQSTPFADPMSLNGCTTEEYVDDRSIPVPVGHETQYMGQSEDVIPIPSMPQSDGVWVQKCYVSGGKAQYVWELET